MALSPAFTVSQSAIATNQFTVTDTSTGSDVTIVARRITVTNSAGNPLTGNGTVNYDDWALIDVALTLTFLTEDIGADILVEWIDINGNTVVSLDNTYPLSEIGKQFFYYLLQAQGLKPGIVMDANYFTNLNVFWINIIAGDHAVTFGNDIAAAQNCYNRETEMRLKQNLFF